MDHDLVALPAVPGPLVRRIQRVGALGRHGRGRRPRHLAAARLGDLRRRRGRCGPGTPRHAPPSDPPATRVLVSWQVELAFGRTRPGARTVRTYRLALRLRASGSSSGRVDSTRVSCAIDISNASSPTSGHARSAPAGRCGPWRPRSAGPRRTAASSTAAPQRRRAIRHSPSARAWRRWPSSTPRLGRADPLTAPPAVSISMTDHLHQRDRRLVHRRHRGDRPCSPTPTCPHEGSGAARPPRWTCRNPTNGV